MAVHSTMSVRRYRIQFIDGKVDEIDAISVTFEYGQYVFSRAFEGIVRGITSRQVKYVTMIGLVDDKTGELVPNDPQPLEDDEEQHLKEEGKV